MNRAFGILEFRAVDEDQRIIEGVASTDLVDDFDTVLLPQGARFDLPLPLLWQHERESPVGQVLSADVTKTRIKVRAQIAKIPEAGPMKDTVDRAWQAIKHGLVRGLSVGFLPVTGGIKGNTFTEWRWKELSIVTLPANSQATISLVRSIAASGDPQPTPGVSGATTSTHPRSKMTISEQITQHENSRAAKVARQGALMDAAGSAGATLDETQSEEYDTLTRDVEAIDGHLARLNSLKLSTEKRAVAVSATNTATASQARSGVAVVTVKPNTDRGIGFARHVMALATCKGNRYEAAEYAKRTWGDGASEVYTGLRDGLHDPRGCCARHHGLRRRSPHRSSSRTTSRTSSRSCAR
jgi:HK97 family phage prohead protease